MKTSTKLKIVGFCLMPIGIVLIILAITVMAQHPFNDPSFDKVPNFGMLIPGVFIAFISLPFLFIGFSPNITKSMAKLQSETMDHAGENLTEAGKKVVDVQAPVMNKMFDSVGPSISKIVRDANGSPATSNEKEQIYCKHCGKAIDVDSKFCKYCSLEQ